MRESIFSQVSPFLPFAVRYVAAKFEVAEKTALEVVQSVLAGLLSKRDETLDNPKRFLLRACRWKALRTLRRRAVECPDVLVALEDEDRERFFGPVSRPEEKTLQIVRDEEEPVELSATVEVPGSVVRMKFSLSKLNHKAS